MSWAEAFTCSESASVLDETRYTWNPSLIPGLLFQLAHAAYVLLLFAFFRHDSGEPNGSPSRSALFSVAKVAVVVWGIVVAFNFIHLVVLTPFTYFQTRALVLQGDHSMPELRDWMGYSLLYLVARVCELTAPFIVYRSALRLRQEPLLPPLYVLAEG